MNYTEPRSVVHLAGLFHKRVFASLAPTTQAISETGLHQVVILIEDRRYRETHMQFHSSVEVLRVPVARRSFLRRWRALATELRASVLARPIYAVHLHGMLPCLVGAHVLAAQEIHARVLYSPCGPRWLERFQMTSAILSRILRAQCALWDQPPVANSLTEARILSRITGRSADLIEYPVASEFFQTLRRTGEVPLVVTIGNAADEQCVDLYTRLAVLLYSEELPIRFSWMGNVGEDARAKLKAANVRVFETSDAADAARYLSQASVFVQTQLADEFPTSVAQAMAMGLPCLTSDTRTHRDFILHGQTGFICTSERDFVERLTILISNAAERSRVGNAARAEAKRRFTGRHFRRRLLGLYGFDETRLRASALEQRR